MNYKPRFGGAFSELWHSLCPSSVVVVTLCPSNCNSAPHSPYAERRNLVCDTLGAFGVPLWDLKTTPPAGVITGRMVWQPIDVFRCRNSGNEVAMYDEFEGFDEFEWV